MSRVDFIVDGEKEAEAHQWSPDDVEISLDGGDTFPLTFSSYEHIVVSVRTEPPKGAELKTD